VTVIPDEAKNTLPSCYNRMKKNLKDEVML